ncbi:MAG: hypothetical protein WCF85_18430 [Rhodospirillaceae bacterium]
MDQASAGFREVVDGVARALAAARHDRDGSYIRTPVLYPGGSVVVVRIEQLQGDRYLVSDMGLGFQEADLMGASPTFVRTAPEVAARAGVRFDQHAFLVLEVRREQLVGAVSIIAACSQEAVQVTAFKLAEKKKVDAADRLCDRLFKLFSPTNVVRNAEILGASNTPWTVTALVTAGGDRAVYEPVSEHPGSVAFSVTKFVDLIQLEHPPARIAVVRSKETLGTRLSLIASAANVVEESVSDGTLERLAHAA